jgi:hypothetical protein
MRHGIAFVDWDNIGALIARVQHNAGGTPRRVEGEHRLHLNEQSGDVESLKHDLRHSLAVGFGVERWLRQKHRVVFRTNAQFIEIKMMPGGERERGGRWILERERESERDKVHSWAPLRAEGV